jgi:hypothetical protein
MPALELVAGADRLRPLADEQAGAGLFAAMAERPSSPREPDRRGDGDEAATSRGGGASDKAHVA